MKTLAAMFAAVLLVAGCGGTSGNPSNNTPGNPSNNTPGNPSNNTSVCAYTKRVGSGGRVYVQMAATPKSLEPSACGAFDGVFGGRSIPVVSRMGTGHVYCRWNKIGSSYTIKSGVSERISETCRKQRGAPGPVIRNGP